MIKSKLKTNKKKIIKLKIKKKIDDVVLSINDSVVVSTHINSFFYGECVVISHVNYPKMALAIILNLEYLLLKMVTIVIRD